MTQELLAEKSGLSKSYIAKVESGQRKLGMGGLRRIANALGVPMDILLQKGITENTSTYEKFAHPIMDLLADCTLYEQEIIFDTMQQLKYTLIQHRKNATSFEESIK